jgi:hypothetical protein
MQIDNDFMNCLASKGQQREMVLGLNTSHRLYDRKSLHKFKIHFIINRDINSYVSLSV